MAAILYFDNMAPPLGTRLGAHQLSNQYDIGHLCAKFGALGRI